LEAAANYESTSGNSMTEAQQKGRRTLILISLLFALPIVGAMYMYYSGTAVPVNNTQHGALISPPRLLPDTALSDQSESFRKIWSLVVLADQTCDALCLAALENIRQIRLSLGPKLPRLQTVFLPAAETAIRSELEAEHPKLIVVMPEVSGEIRAAFSDAIDGEVFLVDPLGNLMMQYPPGTGMSDIRKDIAHLFKLSGIG
jgi:hypothetical protein